MDETFEIRNVDNTLVGKTFTNLTIVEPNKYYQKGDTHSRLYVMCKCNCGRTQLFRYDGLIRGRIESCGHCYDNQYIILNDYVSILKIFNRHTDDWVDILVNTNCVEYLKSKSTWYINMNDNQHVEVRGANKYADQIKKKPSYSLLHRVIVDYINQKYNLSLLTDDQQIDHISGNTFNNLYYPGNDNISKFFNNLRVCNNQQNNLNVDCLGYYKENNKYRAHIIINGIHYKKVCNSPQECINFNIDMIKQHTPENLDFYIFSPTNPRNDPTTFSNTYLNYIGYNDGHRSHFEEFVFTESDEDTEIYTNPNESLNCNLLDDE